jgi:hypothetical protein
VQTAGADAGAPVAKVISGVESMERHFALAAAEVLKAGVNMRRKWLQPNIGGRMQLC